MLSRYLGSFSSKASVAGINLLILLISARYLGAQTRGEISLWLLDIFVVQMVAEIFTGYSLVHFIPRFDFRKLYVGGIFFSFVIIIFFYFYYNLIHKNHSGYFFVLTFLVIVNSFHFVFFLGYGTIQWYNWMSVLQPFLFLMGMLIMVFVWEKKTFVAWLYPVFLSFMIASAVTLYVLFCKVKKQMIFEQTQSFYSIIRNGFLCQMANLFFVLSNRYNYYHLEKLGDVGIYSTATTLAESLMIFSTSLSPILLSDVSRGKGKKFFKKQNMFIFFMVSICVLMIACIPEKVILFFLGSGFVGIKYILLVLSVGSLLNSQTSLFHHYFSGKGILWPAFFSNGAGFLLTWLMAENIASRYGMKGLSFLAVGSYLIIFLITIVLWLIYSDLNE